MKEQRRVKRWPLFQDARLRYEGLGTFFDCVLRDISVTGARISSQERLYADAAIELWIPLPDASHMLRVKAKVIYAQEKHRLFFEYGMVFVHMKQADKEKIFSYLRKNYPASFTSWWGQGNINEKGGGNMLYATGQAEDRRVFDRIPVDLYARYLESVGNIEGYFRIQDIAAKGMGVHVKERLKLGSKLEIWSIPNNRTPVYTRGEVAWVGLDETGREYRAGINLERADFMNISTLLKK